jgi:hypothetical protein
MATEITVLSLQEHCRRGVEFYVENQELAFDFDDSAPRGARIAADAIEAAVYEHIERALERWQQRPSRLGGAPDGS